VSIEDRGHNDPPVLHQLEAEVMDVIWQRGECSVRQVMDAVNDEAGRRRAYTTYMTIMARLDGKGLLQRRRQGRADFYRPRYSRSGYASERARAALDSIVDQFGELALAHIARQMAVLDPQRRQALERIAREN
jgi:predicted transcriptional regulator